MSLSWQHHGKSRVRLGRVWKEGSVHHFVEWQVQSMLESDMSHAYVQGSNKGMVATDTQVGTSHACVDCAVEHDRADTSHDERLSHGHASAIQRMMCCVFAPVQKNTVREHNS